MALSEVLPTYVEPCLSERINSTESVWLNASDFGECYFSPRDSQTYPRLTPVYNGKVLEVQSEILHAGLSGISIKHYYGKCFRENDDDDDDERSLIYQDHQTEMYDFDWDDEEEDKTGSIVLPTEKLRLNVSPADTTESGSFEYQENFEVEGQPPCTLPKINYRNSFWNIHRPELCKLTWGQKYVSAVTVIEHLHDHLVQHGALCQGFHTEEDRTCMLNKELDDYVRLKVLACPRELPPDEPVFDIKNEIEIPKPKINPKCKGILPEIKIPTTLNDRILRIDDEDDDDIEPLHRSKEEFCLTIGKHMRELMFFKSTSTVAESFITPQLSAQEEEASGYFCFDWFVQKGEEYYRDTSEDTTQSSSFSSAESTSPMEPRPRLIMDEFCRAAGKVDFSDLRCNPDF